MGAPQPGFGELFLGSSFWVLLEHRAQGSRRGRLGARGKKPPKASGPRQRRVWRLRGHTRGDRGCALRGGVSSYLASIARDRVGSALERAAGRGGGGVGVWWLKRTHEKEKKNRKKIACWIFNENSLLLRPFLAPQPREELVKALPADRPRYTVPIFPPSPLDLPLCLLQVS